MSKIKTSIAAILVSILARICFYTSKIEIEFANESYNPKNPEFNGNNVIYAFWHGRLFPMAFIRSKKIPTYAVISNHRDGEFITKTMKYLGVFAVRGSTNRIADKDGKGAKDRGGTKAITGMLKRINEGNSIAITPDGPRGPERKVKANSLFVAAKSGVAVLPVSFSCKRGKNFSSWDKLLISYPFSKIYVKVAEPIFVKEEEVELAGKELEKVLNNITDDCDKICDRD